MATRGWTQTTNPKKNKECQLERTEKREIKKLDNFLDGSTS